MAEQTPSFPQSAYSWLLHIFSRLRFIERSLSSSAVGIGRLKLLLLLLFRLRRPSFVVVAIDDDRGRGTFVVILRDFEFIESFDDTAVAEAAPAMLPLL